MTSDVSYLEADKAGKVPRGWAAAQAATTADFAHGSWFWTQVSGGLNYQVPAGIAGSVPCSQSPGLVVDWDGWNHIMGQFCALATNVSYDRPRAPAASSCLLGRHTPYAVGQRKQLQQRVSVIVACVRLLVPCCSQPCT